MSGARLLTLALAAALAQTALQSAGLAALSLTLSIPMVPINAALLYLATSVLGAFWAARAAIRKGPTASVAAAVVPCSAIFLFLAPALIAGPRPAPLATLSIVILFAPLVERMWRTWVLRSSEATPRTSSSANVLAASAPVLAVGLAAATVAPLALPVATVLAGALGAAVFVRQRSDARDTLAFASWMRRIEIGTEVSSCPDDEPPARFADEAAALRLRIEQLALDTRADARAQDEIADARALRTRFMAAMSHELKSPLNSIVGFSQVLEGGIDGELAPEQRESVKMIRSSAQELILLLTDILDLARLEAGKLTLHRQWTPSVEILTEAIERARAFVRGKDVNVEAELQPGLPPVHVDKARIVQAVVGLFRNAAPSLSKTTIRLRARIAAGPPGPERHLRIEIHDALGAISPERLDRIFEAFQEIRVPSGRRIGGLGMALTLSRGLVRLHGGDVWADAPGAGTVLCVAIPLRQR